MKYIQITAIVISIILSFLLVSCGETAGTKSEHNQYLNLGTLLQQCKGNAIVKAKGINEGNFDYRKHLLIIVDDSSNCFEYVGANFDVEVGDTLK